MSSSAGVNVSMIVGLSRRRGGWGWVLPVIATLTLFTLVHGLLQETERTPEDSAEYRLGVSSAAVHFNAYASAMAGDNSVATATEELSIISGDTPCIQLSVILPLSRETQETIGYAEYGKGCDPSSWGYSLSAGRWPENDNEVAATGGVEVPLGSYVDGLTPSPLLVVGMIETPHAIRARTLIAASGTWDSWGWPDVASRFPSLHAVAIGYVTSSDPQVLREYYAHLAQTNPAAGSIFVETARESYTSLMERMPFLYSSTAPVIAVLSVLVALAVRDTHRKSRWALLTDQGVPPRQADLVLLASDTLVLWVSALLGVCLGWLGTLFTGPIAELISGHRASPSPSPLDPVLRTLVPVLVASVTLGWFATNLASRPQRSFAATKKLLQSTSFVRRATTVALLLASFWLAVGSSEVAVGFIAVGLFGLGLGISSPEIVSLISSKGSIRSPQIQLASRRVKGRLGASALSLSAAIISVAPAVALMTMIGAEIDNTNRTNSHPPLPNQAIYYPSPESDISDSVVAIVKNYAGDDYSETWIWGPQTTMEEPVLATQDGFGALSAVDSVAALESVLQQQLSSAAREALQAGGIMWSEGYSGDSVCVWTGKACVWVSMPASVSETYNQRWTNSVVGFMLTATADANGWKMVSPVMVFGGLDATELLDARGALARVGIDQNVLRGPRPEQVFNISPFQGGLILVLAVVAFVIIGATSNANVSALAKQSGDLLALGVPRHWLSGVFLIEATRTILPGILLGAGTALLLSALSAWGHGTPFYAPWSWIGGYMACLCGVTALILIRASRALRIG